MDKILVERIINRTRYIFCLIFLLAGISSYRTSVPPVYIGIFTSLSFYTLIALINQVYIYRKKYSITLVYISVTVEVLIVFLVKYFFHFDEYNGYGLAIKEPSTFIVWFILALICGLRYNKNLNLYFGVFSIICYISLILLGLYEGGITFTSDPKMIFTPLTLRFPTEFAKVLFLAGNTYFLYMMGGFTSRTVQKFIAAKAETDNILKNVKEGIFVLDKEFTILENYSKMMETIFERDNLSRQNFIELLDSMTDEKKIIAIQDYLEILFANRVSEKRLQKLNPLSEISVSIQSESALVEKYLRFSFSRIMEDGEISLLLATVQDITEEIRLSRKIEESEKKAKDNMQLLFGLIHINPVILTKFIEETYGDIKDIEKQLESAQFSENLTELLDSIFRSVHVIKGNAGQLGLDIFAEKAHEFEEKIKDLLEKSDLVPIDLIGLLYSIVGIEESLRSVEELLEKISSFQDFSCKEQISDIELFAQAIDDLVARVSEREDKQVRINLENFSFPEKESMYYLSSLKKILIQIVKNSINHGIEVPEERKASGKPQEGFIKIESHIKDNNFFIRIKDDGRGIQLDSLRKQAIVSGKYKETDVNEMSREQLAQLMFEPGLSTRDGVTIDAGRGVGMDVVKHLIHNLHGRIKTKSSPGKFTEFEITFPIKKVT